MKISELGEWKWIEKLSREFSNSSESTLGIGDDAAALPWDEKHSLLVTTDMLVEGTHFLKDQISPQALGHKSLAVNLSDIAAMGGIPTSAFLSLALPANTDVDWLDRFLFGFRGLAQKFNVELLGGDTTQSQQGLVINVTVLGKIERRKTKLRSQAKAGDLIYVTGTLGDSMAGFHCLQEKRLGDFCRSLIERHQSPWPHLSEAQWLAQYSSVHAMMDTSDGLHLSLQLLLEKSAVGAWIELERLPRSQEFLEACQEFQWNSVELAASGGEDYGLLLTVDPAEALQIEKAYAEVFDLPLTCVGKIVAQPACLEYLRDGRPYLNPISGWNHFGAS